MAPRPLVVVYAGGDLTLDRPLEQDSPSMLALLFGTGRGVAFGDLRVRLCRLYLCIGFVVGLFWHAVETSPPGGRRRGDGVEASGRILA
jgi:hypothetical protein